MKMLPPPGPARTRQLAILAVVVLAGIYVITRVLGSGPATTPVPGARTAITGPPASNTTKTPAAPKAGAASNALPEPVELGKLQAAPEPTDTTRNPFRFGTKPAPPPPPAPVNVAPVVPAQPPGPPPPPPIPPIPLRFIGRMVVDKQTVAVLSDLKGTVFRAMEGQVVDGRYRVVRIGEESLVIEYVNGTGRTTLPLRGS